ncbi:hypothetical protein OG978_39530 [Streptomyces sp. NBC_01591]|uniref:hypothetical protein n=1 Tax=Streptomyces sp. NBC_01591 TaxID=2975888 RepID=UPI002DDBA8FC|nr:hypothetical protein [Streptomyces sp. NBC_01591]WSD72932.1 hypothetical protein OG978_39530 [Streptomyces sp. NBC_01591]
MAVLALFLEKFTKSGGVRFPIGQAGRTAGFGLVLDGVGVGERGSTMVSKTCTT